MSRLGHQDTSAATALNGGLDIVAALVGNIDHAVVYDLLNHFAGTLGIQGDIAPDVEVINATVARLAEALAPELMGIAAVAGPMDV